LYGFHFAYYWEKSISGPEISIALKYINYKPEISIENINFEPALRNDKKRIETKMFI
jgi:hypothetical protein